MSKPAAPDPDLLFRLIWPRNFKCSRERRKQAALVGGKTNSGGFALLCFGQSCLLQMVTPYGREDHNSLMVFDVEVELGVDLVDDRVDRVRRVGQQ